MGWGNNLRRRVKIFTLAISIYLDYKVLEKREKWFNKNNQDVLWERAHERNSKRLLRAITELQGLWVKLGQYLSTRADVLPDAYIKCLRLLQDSLPPRPLKEVYYTVQKELGKPIEELFASFEETPLAAASIAQVHRSCMKNGQNVVVKVQHKGIKEIILQDLKDAKKIVEWIAWAEPEYNFSPVINEWCNEAPKELDFNIEAENTRKVAENLCCGSQQHRVNDANFVDVLVPKVIESTERVIILEYMDGTRLNDREALDALGVDKQKLVESITRAYAHQIYVDGFFNGDPHPGNFLVSKEAPFRPILLDFGLTKSISTSLKQALAKMLLAAAEGDYAALLSAFSEMGLRLRLDIPEEAMAITKMVFRDSAPAKESLENIKSFVKERNENHRSIQEKMQKQEKNAHRNPVDAFPSDAVIFFRVLNLLRGLSSLLDVRIVYLDIMRPFAEAALLGESVSHGITPNSEWIYNSPVHSEVETKLRHLLLELGRQKHITGIQVCAYKDGKVIIDTAAGTLGKYDPRPVKHDSLFNVFSATKGVTAGLVHWLADRGEFTLNSYVAEIWPNFGANGKEQCKIAHVLNHTAGLHNALADVIKEEPYTMCKWEELIQKIALTTPESMPGTQQNYHFLSFGWLCGGIIEALGKRFQEVLEEALVRPLGLDGELYIGIPPGVESRVASLSIDKGALQKLVSKSDAFPEQQLNGASSNRGWFSNGDIGSLASTLPAIFNMLFIRRAIIPAANGHCSARALARYYAALATGGIVPPKPSFSSNEPPLGSHPHKPSFSSSGEVEKNKRRAIFGCCKGSKKAQGEILTGLNKKNESVCLDIKPPNDYVSLFSKPDIIDAFLGIGAYEELVHPNGTFGLGFRRFPTTNSTVANTRRISFGHSGIGGSTGFCDPNHNFAIAITVNQMSLGEVTRQIIQLVCSELNITVPSDFAEGGQIGPGMQLTNLLEE